MNMFITAGLPTSGDKLLSQLNYSPGWWFLACDHYLPNVQFGSDECLITTQPGRWCGGDVVSSLVRHMIRWWYITEHHWLRVGSNGEAHQIATRPVWHPVEISGLPQLGWCMVRRGCFHDPWGTDIWSDGYAFMIAGRPLFGSVEMLWRSPLDQCMVWRWQMFDRNWLVLGSGDDTCLIAVGLAYHTVDFWTFPPSARCLIRQDVHLIGAGSEPGFVSADDNALIINDTGAAKIANTDAAFVNTNL